MVYITVFIILGLLIFIHEAGHLTAAHLLKLPVKRFSLGFGPRLFGVQWRGTDYCLSLIPLGGYVMLRLKDLDELFQVPVLKRILYFLAGPLANLLLLIPIFAIMNVVSNGWSISNCLVAPFFQSQILAQGLLADIAGLFNQPDQIGGVIGLVSQGGEVISHGFRFACILAAYISLNFAVINLFPIPIMDGGQILLSLAEIVTPAVKRIRIPLAIAGWVLMLGLFIYATAQDLFRIYT
ncbi:MAG: site-2 protease family protein [Syntrophomonadaceae bacterium]